MKIPIAGVAVLLTVFGVLQWKSATHVASAGFWFERVTYELAQAQVDRLGGPITPAEMKAIQSVAWSELRAAFAGLRVASEGAGPMYSVRVVQEIPRHPLSPFRASFGAAGESRFVRPLGGFGAVSFGVLAGNAIAFAPPNAGRPVMIEAIGRGIGRAAAHEFAHEFLATRPIHATTDVRSYEYRSADRAEQYYGPMHWDIAGPLLHERLGATASSSR